MLKETFDIIVGGHICLDLLPDLRHVAAEGVGRPGCLAECGPLAVSSGGAVSNTGLALHRLGTRVGLMAKVGDDPIGKMIVDFLNERGPALASLIKVDAASASSYSVVLAPAGQDRSFLHHPGANATFSAADVDDRQVGRAAMFHLGYPPLMPRLTEDQGADLEAIYARTKASGVVTSMDMVVPDANGASGTVSWPAILRRVLPSVDVFLPSIDEALFMLRRADFDEWRGDVLPNLDRAYLAALAGELLEMGVVVAGFKLGEMGLYLRTAGASAVKRLEKLPLARSEWADREYWYPAYDVRVKGTTGAGDAAYAGFLAAMHRGLPPEACLQWASAVGACNVEQVDAVSGVRSWAETERRLESGWATKTARLHGYGH